MNSKKVSIVIPIYNGKKYIEQVAENLSKQTFKDFEAIFVNDGSVDGSTEFLDKLSKKNYFYPITVIHKENGGVSAARNRGIEAATGKYICFLDVDDIISNDYLELLVEAIRNSDTRIAMGYISRSITELTERENTEVCVFDKNNFLREFLYRGIKYSVCAGIYERECFKEFGLCFPEGYRYSEDVYLLWQLFARLEKIAVVPTAIYYYFDNPISAMNGTIDLKREQAIKLMERLEPVMKEYAPEFSKEFCDYAVARHHWSILWQAACMLNEYSKFTEYADHFEMKPMLKKLYAYPSKSVSLSAKLYCIAPRLYYRLIRIYKKRKSKNKD